MNACYFCKLEVPPVTTKDTDDWYFKENNDVWNRKRELNARMKRAMPMGMIAHRSCVVQWFEDKVLKSNKNSEEASRRPDPLFQVPRSRFLTEAT